MRRDRVSPVAHRLPLLSVRSGYINQPVFFSSNPPPPPPPSPPPPPPPAAPPPPPVGIMPQLNFTATFLNLTAAAAANISSFQAR